MAQRGLTLSEALKVFHELPSDCESEREDSSYTKVYAPEPLVQSDDDMSDETHLSDKEDDDPSQPGFTTQPLVPTWNSKQKLQKILLEFTSISGPNAKLWELSAKTLLAVFQEISSLQLIEHVVFQTNPYATQKSKPFSPLTLVELYIFLGINLLMGIKRMPSYKDYWANNEALGDKFICRYMSCRRFSWILVNLRLNDNVLELKRNDANFDRLYKVRPLLDYLSKRFLDALHPSENC
ncbi:uncharacterized protein LOC118190546 [Stegodyphus dumicola]|uniref:uncharacterized protein LOC118190546 n=1 Tax=Stegodyphus dumicola TaxID=202533 RepID=UPI0015AC539C|nr:uncharacterized protein LOC118190546 [Stegodyphus dumicola]